MNVQRKNIEQRVNLYKSPVQFMGLVFFISSFMLGCAHTSGVTQTDKTQDMQKRVGLLEAQLVQLQSEVRDLAEKNLVFEAALKKTDTPQSLPLQESDAEAAMQESIFAKQPVMLPLPEVAQEKTPRGRGEDHREDSQGDDLLYVKAVSSYRKKETENLRQAVYLLEKGYPQSSWVDNALYLLAKHYHEKGELKKSIWGYQRLMKKYPQSNKWVSSMYEKAMALKALHRPRYALKLLKQVAQKFPGSRESYLAQTEIKILKTENSTW